MSVDPYYPVTGNAPARCRHEAAHPGLWNGLTGQADNYANCHRCALEKIERLQGIEVEADYSLQSSKSAERLCSGDSMRYQHGYQRAMKEMGAMFKEAAEAAGGECDD